MRKKVRPKLNVRKGRAQAESQRTEQLFDKLMSSKSYSFPAKGNSLGIRDRHGVYVIFGSADRVLHVGRTLRGKRGLWQRLNGHLNGQSSFVHTYLEGNKGQLRKKCRYKFIYIGHPRRRALLEHFAVGVLSPAHLGTGKALDGNAR
jgi:hypothetical protein